MPGAGLNKRTPIVGRIYSPECGHCAQMEGAWREMRVHARKSGVRVLDINTGKPGADAAISQVNARLLNSQQKQKLEYDSVPTIFGICHGQIVYHTGARDADTLKALVDTGAALCRKSLKTLGGGGGKTKGGRARLSRRARSSCARKTPVAARGPRRSRRKA